MGKKIIFLSFINGKQDRSEDGGKWKKDLENDFLKDPDIVNDTAKIEGIRGEKNTKSEYVADIQVYYKELHAAKAIRQAKWLNKLSAETAAQFRNRLDALTEVEKDPKKCIVVAALPEFFWYDINDNNKHDADDKYYHKSIYENTLYDTLWAQSNPLAKLTAEFPNLIIFAGTALWKKINQSKHEEDRIYNSMFVYCGGKIGTAWTKYHVSNIDGLSLPQKFDKVEKDRIEIIPYIEFGGARFTYDVCLDFTMGYKAEPLSTTMCRKEKKITDVNVLVAAGMSIDDKDLNNINSPIILRCDGLASPYAQIALKNASSTGTAGRIVSGEIIGRLETDTDIPEEKENNEEGN